MTGAFPTGTMTTTTLANVIPVIWTKEKVNDYYKSQLIAANHFTDLSSEIAGGGEVVYIPNLTAMTAHTKTTGSPVTVNAITDGKITLNVTTKKECSFAIEDMDGDAVKKSYSYIDKQMANAAYEVAKAYEQAILDLFAGFSQTTGTSAAGVADSNIRAAIKALDTANVPADGRAFFFSPKAMWTDIMALDRFTLLQNTATGDPVKNGLKGMLYGIPVYVSPLIGTTTGSARNALAHKDAIVHASTGLTTQSNYVPHQLATVVTAYAKFGAAENRDTSGVWIKTAAA